MKWSLVLAVCTVLLPMRAMAQSAPIVQCSSLGASAPKMQTKMVLEDYYPSMSIYLGEEGSTTVKYVVQKNGTVSDVEVVQGSGSARLDSATVFAMQQMLYSQPMSNAVSVDCSADLRIVWKLRGAPADGTQKFPLIKPSLSDYPPTALRDHREGAAVVSVLIRVSGEVDAKIKRSSGSDDLDAASLAFVEARKFKPAEMDGLPAWSAISVIVDWELAPSKTANGKSK